MENIFKRKIKDPSCAMEEEEEEVKKYSFIFDIKNSSKIL